MAYTQKRDIKRRKADGISWHVGQEVKLKPEHQSTRPYDEVGIVKKVNIVKIRVEFLSGVWTIPKTMLDVV